MADPAYRRADYKAAKQAFKGKPCVICGRPSDTVEHYPPKSTVSNPATYPFKYFPMCGRCNMSRGGKMGARKTAALKRRRRVVRGWAA